MVVIIESMYRVYRVMDWLLPEGSCMLMIIKNWFVHSFAFSEECIAKLRFFVVAAKSQLIDNPSIMLIEKILYAW